MYKRQRQAMAGGPEVEHQEEVLGERPWASTERQICYQLLLLEDVYL